MSDDKHSKTEKPTGKKISDAKSKGNVPRSREMTSAVTLIAAMVALYASSGIMLKTLQETMKDIFGGLATIEITPAGVHHLMIKEFTNLAIMLTPFLLVCLIAGLGVEISQGGVNLSSEKLKFDLGRLNPVQGVGRLFNKDSLFEVAKSFLKMGIVGYMAYKILTEEMEGIIFLVDQDLQGILQFIGHIAFKIVLHTCGVLIILAVLDLAFVKWRFLDNLKMTKQEVKDENKNSEGDPAIKGKQRQKAFQMARRRMRQIIPTADVVVTNPTHYAVALKYDRFKMSAPVVLFKGVDQMALQMKIVARENNVTLVENRFLARELYAQVEEGYEIPEGLFAAVAEILAYVYSLKRR
ncbi:flagellar biosynthesis protein FlhB [Geomonas nitrogeniifigens]|uniref:Flagellar biosynthetic protein FlhB n=1 Tax=Geomonas diazotrophica TaxID=2843197 RepID=A0ABX8JNV7_9BACT|nr:flagellar biosynthesis protein FlhB [Geomonas nitrogeniifigens]QWV97110.1 flagellar biosynthesis protein FlhB [Geomonas nitrogeniifigens]QXE86282.1 flagellar biosynthesis protein FlhB [Geomonas nitrogeniifigens]